MLGDAQKMVSRSIAAVLPDEAVFRALRGRTFSRPVIVVAIGKAAWRMARAAHDALEGQVSRGIVITKYAHSEGPIGNLEIYEAGHPVPDENGVAAARRALELVDGLAPEDMVIFLISGGGSALFELPAEGVSLTDIADMTRQLLACGADIAEINTIRKRLSAVKGGRFALACRPAKVLCVVLSDVLGDPLDAIASGPAAPDSATSEDAARIVEKYGLSVRGHVAALLKRETPKTLEGIESIVTGSVTQLCAAAAQAAQALGYAPHVLTTTLSYEAREAGERLAALAREIRAGKSPWQPPCAIIMGGETVVHLKGSGKGGRNQEIALAAAKEIDGMENVCIFSLGSDGTDGPTDAAGGVVTGRTAQQAREMGLSIDAALEDNDAYPLLEKLGALIMTGPTGTNVNDVSVLLIR